VLTLQAPPSGQKINERDLRYYGWRVVVAANLGIMVGLSLYAYTFGIFVKPLAAQFGWSRQAISQGFAISALAAAVCSPLAGRWLDRHAPRRLLLSCMALFGLAIAALSLSRPFIWQFYVTCFVIGAVGNVSQIGYAHAISTWFHDCRGTALGLVLAGDGIGLMIFPVLAQTLVAHSGWRVAYQVLGSLALLIALTPGFPYARFRPQSEGEARVSEHSGLTWQEGLRSHSFWIIVAVLFLTSISINGAMAHQVPLLTDRGVAASSAALTVSVLGGAGLAGRLLTGWLLDRLPGSWVACALLMLAAGGILLLARLASFSLGCVAAALLGFGAGGTSNTTPYLLTRYFGLRSFSTLYGLTWTFYAIAGGTGPVLLGHVFDRTGSYTSTLTILGFASAFGAALMLLLPRYEIPRAGGVEWLVDGRPSEKAI
jgi:MFS family permease